MESGTRRSLPVASWNGIARSCHHVASQNANSDVLPTVWNLWNIGVTLDVVERNPLENKSKTMVGFGNEEYKQLLCVNGVERAITLNQGRSSSQGS